MDFLGLEGSELQYHIRLNCDLLLCTIQNKSHLVSIVLLRTPFRLLDHSNLKPTHNYVVFR
jgi:hypothetical protein